MMATMLMLAGLLAPPAFAQPTVPTKPGATVPVKPGAQVPTKPPTPPAAPAAPGEPAPPVPPPPPMPPRMGQSVNIKVDVTITDQGRASVAAVKKTVSIVTGDGFSGRIRTTANYAGLGDLPLNVDTDPHILSDGKIRVTLGLQYSLPGTVSGQGGEAQSAGGGLRFTQIQETIPVILENGKSIIVAQSADPVGDRQVTIEVKATILK
jgi:hypothetical protein